jgi:hypothetical protein
MSGVVPFILREQAGRKHNPALCDSPNEPSADHDKGYFIEPISEFTLCNSISSTRWAAPFDARTFPSPVTSTPIDDAKPQDPGKPTIAIPILMLQIAMIRAHHFLYNRRSQLIILECNSAYSTLQDFPMKLLRW